MIFKSRKDGGNQEKMVEMERKKGGQLMGVGDQGTDRDERREN